MRLLALVALLAGTAPAHAEDAVCRVIGVELTPQAIANQEPFRSAPQIVAWIETTAGEYVETVFITDAVGRYGLGNRPGRPDFNSGPLWPYGRRTMTFPVWASRHGQEFPLVEFQDDLDSELSHAMDESSPELHFCAPRLPGDASWDGISCATPPFTDKGVFRDGVGKYPPRSDLALMPEDTADISMYSELNVFDAVSRATPEEGVPAMLTWLTPPGFAVGDYVMWVEVAREFDHNETYSVAARPAPVVSFEEWGLPYRGQPSVLYRVPFTVNATDSTAVALDYAGYGDPDGLDGNVRPPDTTITSGVAGSGAERLAVQSDDGTPFRVRVSSMVMNDPLAPSAATDFAAMDVTSAGATVVFAAPGDDGDDGRADAYEIRYRIGEPITEENFASSLVVGNIPVPADAGTTQSITLDRLLYDTEYSVGVRATDDCDRVGPLAVFTFKTAERRSGDVDACFIATAAYGSVLATDVTALRTFRDRVLRHSVLGQLAIQSYYTFGPALAGVIAESDPLRAIARELLAPIVDRLRGHQGAGL